MRSGTLSRRCGRVASALLARTIAASSTVQAAREPVTSGGPTTARRFNEVEYLRSIEDIFGAGIKIPGRFDSRHAPRRGFSSHRQFQGRRSPLPASSGIDSGRRKSCRCWEFGATASCRARRRPQRRSMNPARAIRRQVRPPPLPAAATEDEKSATLRRERRGRAVRRLLPRAAGRAGAPARLAEFHLPCRGTEPRSARTGLQRLDDYSLATRISFLLWDAPPDAALLDAAASGALREQAGLDARSIA